MIAFLLLLRHYEYSPVNIRGIHNTTSKFQKSGKNRNMGQVRRVQDMASDKVVWILSSRMHLGAHFGKVFF